MINEDTRMEICDYIALSGIILLVMSGGGLIVSIATWNGDVLAGSARLFVIGAALYLGSMFTFTKGGNNADSNPE